VSEVNSARRKFQDVVVNEVGQHWRTLRGESPGKSRTQDSAPRGDWEGSAMQNSLGTVTASNWRPLQRNTLRGFVDITLSDPGLIIHGCTLHARDGDRWISMPAKAFSDADGVQHWNSVVEFSDREAKVAFQQAALPAVSRLLQETKP
jgi:hypothetical protein